MFISNKASIYSRAYIDFKHPDDVFEFHQQFNGHIFVNEKGKSFCLKENWNGICDTNAGAILTGTQYKAMVEYAPNQRVPKLWHKKDAREGAILQGKTNGWHDKLFILGTRTHHFVLIRLHFSICFGGTLFLGSRLYFTTYSYASFAT